MSVDAPEPLATRDFQWPAEYYAGPTPTAVLPRWAPFGCGGAALFVLVIVFVGGAWLAGGGFTQMMDMVFGMTLGEMRGMYAADVTAAQKTALETEIEALRKNLREEKVAPAALDPVLQTMRRATSDEKLTGKEVEEIAGAARKANVGRKVSKEGGRVSETLRL